MRFDLCDKLFGECLCPLHIGYVEQKFAHIVDCDNGRKNCNAGINQMVVNRLFDFFEVFTIETLGERPIIVNVERNDEF